MRCNCYSYYCDCVVVDVVVIIIMFNLIMLGAFQGAPYRCLRKKRPYGYIAILENKRFDAYSAVYVAYRLISLYKRVGVVLHRHRYQ